MYGSGAITQTLNYAGEVNMLALWELANIFGVTIEMLMTESISGLLDVYMKNHHPEARKLYCPGELPVINNLSGLHRDVGVYDLNPQYYKQCATTPLSNEVARVFVNYPYGYEIWSSGYFDFPDTEFHSNLVSKILGGDVVYLSCATLLSVGGTDLHRSRSLQMVYGYGDSAVVYDKGNRINLGKGVLTYPPCIAIHKYIDAGLQRLHITGGNKLDVASLAVETTPDDYLLTTKIYKDTHTKLEKTLLEQLKSTGELFFGDTYNIRYLQTTYGPIIESVYMSNPALYSLSIDYGYYSSILNGILKYVV